MLASLSKHAIAIRDQVVGLGVTPDNLAVFKCCTSRRVLDGRSSLR